MFPIGFFLSALFGRALRQKGAILAERVSKSKVGETMVGRVLSFDTVKGYGFIRTSTGEDIFLSSYEISKREWKNLCVGDYVEFTVGLHERGRINSVAAKSVTITKKMPKKLAISLPNQEELMIRHIRQFAKGSLIEDGYAEIYPDYPTRGFDYAFIKTPKRTFTFNHSESPVIVDGVTDVDEFYGSLVDLLCEYDIERDYEAI